MQALSNTNFEKRWSIVYSSDMASTSCYSMASIGTGYSISSMTTLTTMVSLASSIYGPSTVTFVNDTQAYTTVDIGLTHICHMPAGDLDKSSTCSFVPS